MISAIELTEALAAVRGVAPQLPTSEQQAVIEAGDEPVLIVAGAGSGKTHTMAQRVLWLVANGKARPDEILGLTFTRKAAGELRGRLREELAMLDETPDAPEGIRGLVPGVQTYNSFASGLFKEWALLIGRDPESELLSDAAAFLLALRVTRAADDLRLAGLGYAPAIADRVLQLAGELSDHHVSTDDVRRRGFPALFEALSALPVAAEGERSLAAGRKGLAEDVQRVGSLTVLLDLVDAFEAEKRQRGAVQFSDQVRLALDALRAHSDAVAELRSRYRYVLLDEFQDTSVLQLRLLHELFGGMPVMAVGDPNQAIYGFRGASAGTLVLFAQDFGVRETLSLSTSWRNDVGVLALAHDLAAQLPEQEGVPVEPLTARSEAGTGSVTVAHLETARDEVAQLAQWFSERGAGLSRPGPTAAVLVHSHADGAALTAALRAEGLSVSRFGGGGLLEVPEVVDLVAALRVVGRPEEGSSLVRLLAGSRWRVGVADLAALQRLAHRLATSGVSDAARQADRAAVVPEAASSIVEALDAALDSGAIDGVSEEGMARLRDAGALLRTLRSRIGMPLPDFVRSVAHALRLDIEVGAKPDGSHAALDAFVREATAYANADEVGSLDGFLRYLDVLDDGRGPDAPQPEPAEGVVQVMTMHAAKGLEWDLVALPRLAAFRSADRSRGWLDWARLPYPLRGDASLLPVLQLHGHASQVSYADARAAFIDALAEHTSAEAERLSYVAVTRARSDLWVSGAQWYSGAKAAKPLPLLTLAASHCGVSLLSAPDKQAENPLAAEAVTVTWPVDPLGSRRASLEHAAALVRDADPGSPTPWDDAIAMLLSDRSTAALTPPARIAASGFKDWAADPVAAAQRSARPMPERPFAATRLGTLFHGWVERRGAAIGLGDAVDDAPLDDEFVGVDEARLQRLKATFLASPYGDRQPSDVELEVQLPLSGTTVVCKIDAVYRDGERALVVDWKTGALPKDADDLAARQLQLALYRAAYAAHSGLDPRLIDAELYFVEHDEIIRLDELDSIEELEGRWARVVSALDET